MEFARRERLKISGNPSQYDDLRAIHDEQAFRRGFVEQSRLPTLTFDVSDDDIPRAVEAIADWCERTGGNTQ
jgi:hypothetical protein